MLLVLLHRIVYMENGFIQMQARDGMYTMQTVSQTRIDARTQSNAEMHI